MTIEQLEDFEARKMATAAVQLPPSNRLEPGSNELRTASYPDADTIPKVDVDKIASEWVDAFKKLLAGNYDSAKELFIPDSCWRDQLGLSWNYRSLNGPDKITSFLKEAANGSRIKSITIDTSSAIRKPNVAPMDYHAKAFGIGSFLTIETDVGRGRGFLRLVQDSKDDGKWKAYILFTAMYELKGHEESTFGNRPQGVEHGGQAGRKNWQDRRRAMENYEGDLEPTVMIIGKFLEVHQKDR